MKSIYKFILHPASKTILTSGSYKVISALAQDDNIVIYGLVDVEDETVKEIEYIVLGTGHYIEKVKLEGFEFINTVQMNNGLIFHVFIKDNGF